VQARVRRLFQATHRLNEVVADLGDIADSIDGAGVLQVVVERDVEGEGDEVHEPEEDEAGEHPARDLGGAVSPLPHERQDRQDRNWDG
jgi:hypothetical protein